MQLTLTKNSESGIQNYYTLIGLNQTASEEEIKSAIAAKRKAEAKGTNSSKVEKRQEAERIMQLLHDAHSVLLDAQKRAKYDQELKSAPARNARLISRISREKRTSLRLAGNCSSKERLRMRYTLPLRQPSEMPATLTLGHCLGKPSFVGVKLTTRSTSTSEP